MNEKQWHQSMKAVNRIKASQEASKRKKLVQEPISRAIPPALAIIPVSMLFGILAARADWSILQVFTAGLLGFTGSGQFALLPLTESGAGFMTMLLLCASINSRYFPISFTTHSRLPKSLFARTSVAHMLGDEAYAIERTNDSPGDTSIIRITIFITWVISGVVGALIAQAIPDAWISKDLHLGFPASAVLIYLSIAQLKERMKGLFNQQLLPLATCSAISICLIGLLGPVFFWLPSVAITAIILFLWVNHE